MVETTRENFSNFKVMNNEAVKQIKIASSVKDCKKQAVGREIANRQVRANFQYQKFLMLGPTKMFKDGIKSEKCLVQVSNVIYS